MTSGRVVPAAASGGGAGLFLGVAFATLLTRLPFLGAGYGLDPDAWRVALAARRIAATGAYSASRFPGYPIHEMASALLLGGGWWAANAASAAMSGFAAGFFALALRDRGVRDAWLGALAFAMTPVIYVAGTSGVDTAWALAGVTASLWLAGRGHAGVAGLALGWATGCRPTSLLLAPATGWIAATARGARGGGVAKSWIRFLVGLAAVMAAAFAPVVLTYGTTFLRAYEHGYPSPVLVVKNATVDVWGIPGTIAIVVAALAALVRSRGRVVAARRPMSFAGAWTLAIVLLLLLFLRLPHEAAYLAPAVPFTLLLLSRYLSRRGFASLCVALLVSPFALKLSQTGKPDSPRASAWSIPARAGYVLDGRGPILTDRERRRRGMAYVGRVVETARELPGENAIAAWEWLPQIQARWGSEVGGARFVYVYDDTTIARERARGAALWYLPGADVESRVVHGVDVIAAGARPLPVPPEPRGRRGSAGRPRPASSSPPVTGG